MCRFIRGKIEGDTDQSTDSIEQLSEMLKSGKIKVEEGFEENSVMFGGASADSGADSVVEDPGWNMGNVGAHDSDYDEEEVPDED